MDDKTNGTGESFADLIDEYGQAPAGANEVGDKVAGKVISIGETTIFVDTGGKLDGVVERTELENDEGELTVAEGDEVELYVVGKDSGGIKLSRAVGGVGGLMMLTEAYEKKLPVEGKVAATRKGGFDVTVLQRRAFCPVSQIDDAFVETPEDYVGQSLEFLITKLEQKGRNIVVSRRALLERQSAEAAQEFLKTAKTGDVIEGEVVRFAPFGAFVRIVPGVEGLVHISAICHARIGKPDEALSLGQQVKAKITALQLDDKDRLKVSLDMKQLAQDPWDTVAATFSAGDKVPGTVVRLADFGAFVEIAPGVDGLVHLSEMSWAGRVHKAEDVVKVGQSVPVKIKEIDLEKRRISLSIRDAEGDPWVEAAEKFAAGAIVDGTVDGREQFGLFIQLAPGISGLLHTSAMAKSANPKAYETLKKGDAAQVKVLDIDTGRRRISLAPADAPDDLDQGDWKQHAAKGKAPRKGGRPAKNGGAPNGGGGVFGDAGGMGSLGDALQAALKKK